MISSKRIRLMMGELEHESTWKTDNVGTSNDDQITLPLIATGSYEFVVQWGDGLSNYIDTWNQAEVTHTYPASGTYKVKITGKCWGFQFNNGGDKLKILTIERWGKDFNLGNNNSVFYGCANLVINAKDILDTSMMTDFYQLFRDCAALNADLNFNDTSNVTNHTYMLRGCVAFNGSVSKIDTTNSTTLAGMFYECNAFNQPVSHFNTAKVDNMYALFYNCTAFNQDISNLNIESVTNVNYFLDGATSFSTANYDLFLIEIATNQNVVDSLTFHASSTYTSGGAAEAARTDLATTDLWTINDLGAA